MRKIFAILLILILLFTASCSNCSSCCKHNYLGETLAFPTCESSGTRKYTCETCEDSYYEEMEEIWHTAGSDRKCVRCEKDLVTDINVAYTQDTKAYVILSANCSYDENMELIFERERNGFEYREIGDSAFMNGVFKKISLPSTIKKINANAFKNCLNLFSVNFNKGVKVIDDGAFFGCITLSEITIYPSLVSIGRDAFSECLYLEKINFVGTREQFESIAVGSGNDYFLNATVTYITE